MTYLLLFLETFPKWYSNVKKNIVSLIKADVDCSRAFSNLNEYISQHM